MFRKCMGIGLIHYHFQRVFLLPVIAFISVSFVMLVPFPQAANLPRKESPVPYKCFSSCHKVAVRGDWGGNCEAYIQAGLD